MSCSTVWEREQLKEWQARSASVVEPSVFNILQIERNVVQQWSVGAPAVVYTHGGAPEENQAEEQPSAFRQRYLGRLLTRAAPFCLQEHYRSLLPEGLQQRPGAGVQPWAEARQRWCQGEYSTRMQMVSLTAAEGRRASAESPTLTSCLQEGMSQGVFYCYARGPACGLWFGLKKGQANSNYGAIVVPYSPSDIIPNLLRSYSTCFFCPCGCNQTEPLTELFPQALLPKSTSLILLTPLSYPPPPSPPAAGFAPTTLSYDRNCINLRHGVCAVSAVNDPFYWQMELRFQRWFINSFYSGRGELFFCCLLPNRYRIMQYAVDTIQRISIVWVKWNFTEAFV